MSGPQIFLCDLFDTIPVVSANICLHLPFTGVDNATTCEDTSQYNNPVALYDSAKIITSVADPFGNYNGVLYMNNSHVTVTDLGNISPGTSDFTFSGYLYYLTANAYYGRLFTFGASAEHLGIYLNYGTMFERCLEGDNGDWNWNTVSMPTNTWVKLEVSRVGTTTTLKMNDVIIATKTILLETPYTIVGSTLHFGIPGWSFTGYLSNWILSKP
jgi:hypothetical protein